ncbi:MAG: alpha-amylase [Actinomycetales bacterium]|nr:alpha-amylase [Actinomycetales bacterium]
MVVVSWPGDVVWWHVYPLGFTGAPGLVGDTHPDSAGDASRELPVTDRLDRLLPWLDYVAELGCSGLILGPVFASRSHGYDTLDHFRIDPRLGDAASFDRLVKQAAERGLRVVLDGVFNHVGRGFRQFQEALRDGPDSEAARWFRIHWDREHPDFGGPDHDCFEGHRDLVALEHGEPAVADHVTRVMTHWLDRGASGWRLDAAYAVPPEFWAPVLRRVRAEHPDAWVFGEMIHEDYVEYVETSGLDGVTQYELWKAVWSSLNDGNFFELDHALGRHARFAEAFLPQTFIGNHDVTRLGTRLDDPRHLPHALAILFTVAGTPSVYYGDEQAFRGEKEERFGGDDEIRPSFPATPAELAPHGWPIYRLHQRLVAVRRRHPWLARGRTTVEHLTERTVVLRTVPRADGPAVRSADGPAVRSADGPAVRSADGPAAGGPPAVTTLLNSADEPATVPADRLPGLGRSRVEAGDDLHLDGDGDVVLGPYGWSVLSVG